MAELLKHQVIPGDEQRLIDRAKAAREAEKAQASIDEMAAAKAHARKHAERTGVHRADGNGYQLIKTMKVSTPDLLPDKRRSTSRI